MEPENAENEPPANQIKVSTTNGAATEFNGKGFRVKNVAEINANTNCFNETVGNSNKRKFSAPIIEENESENECTKAKISNNNNDEINMENNDTEQSNELKVDNLQTVQIKTETISSEDNVDIAVSEESAPVKVKSEPADSTVNDGEPSCSNGNADSTETKVKVETPTIRESCRFGIGCFKQTANHRQEEAHPGDADYRRPTFPAPPPGTPQCPFGVSCYRRNPTHFAQYAHPDDNLYIPNISLNSAQTQIPQNIIPPRMNIWIAEEEDNTSDSESDLFGGPYGDSDDYAPSNDETDDDLSEDCGDYPPSDDEIDDDLSADYDDCDRVEE